MDVSVNVNLDEVVDVDASVDKDRHRRMGVIWSGWGWMGVDEEE